MKTEAAGGAADAGLLDPDSFGPSSSTGRGLPPAGPASFPGMDGPVCVTSGLPVGAVMVIKL